MKWLSLHIGGQKWSVYLVAGSSKHLREEDGSLLDGRTYYETCRIYVARDIDAEAREDTLLHELLHAMLHVSGANAAYGKDVEQEERIVAPLVPCMHRLLKDLGFRFPRGLYQ